MLDGQAIVLDDYLAVRPQSRRPVARRASRAGRLAAGPWYVQPDSLLPCGRDARAQPAARPRASRRRSEPVSHVAYVPDSFGHPAQFPQLFAGFGLDPFVYWRGNGTEIDALAPLLPLARARRHRDARLVSAEGYFGAGGLDADGDAARDRRRGSDR